MSRKQILLSVYFGSWILYFGYFWLKLFNIDAAGNLVAGHVNVWGDWAAHFTMGSAMGYRQLLLPVSPLLSTAQFSYPFVADLISGIFIKLGIPFLESFVYPSLFFSITIVFALYYFYKVLFKSSKVAILASLIFLLNGGVGWYYFAQDITHSPQPWKTFFNPPHEYTRLDNQHLKWISVIDSMIIPQRSFTVGFPLTLFALALIYSLLEKPQKKHLKVSTLKIVASAVILGLMPLIHTHSFLAAGIVLSFWFSVYFLVGTQQQRLYLLRLALQIAGLTSLLAFPIIYHYFFTQVSHGFFRWYPGWLAKEYDDNWFIFWFKNWQIVPLLALVGWINLLKLELPKKKPRLLKPLLTYMPFFFLILYFLPVFILEIREKYSEPFSLFLAPPRLPN